LPGHAAVQVAVQREAPMLGTRLLRTRVKVHANAAVVS
jgi:hypothetical protein